MCSRARNTVSREHPKRPANQTGEEARSMNSSSLDTYPVHADACAHACDE